MHPAEGGVLICLCLLIFFFCATLFPIPVIFWAKVVHLGVFPYETKRSLPFPVEHISVFDESPNANKELARLNFVTLHLLQIIVSTEKQKCEVLLWRIIGWNDCGQIIN